MKFKNIETIENEKKRIKWGEGLKKYVFQKVFIVQYIAIASIILIYIEQYFILIKKQD